MASFYYVCWLLAVQVRPGGDSATGAAAEAAQNAAGGGAGNAGAGGGGLFDSLYTFLPMMMIMMVIYVLFMLPRQQQKDQAQTSEMLENLKKNDEIVTAGGIRGTVVNFRDGGEFLTIRIDENTNTKMKILKKSVIRVLTGDEKKSD